MKGGGVKDIIVLIVMIFICVGGTAAYVNEAALNEAVICITTFYVGGIMVTSVALAAVLLQPKLHAPT
eukprot:CAMPEP_0205924492 /NCGR_PEP_ID=MMETSP1325-20131115/17008_1 /ASSEMBLY_ACC=CAM_ASM_000708 /TAXON_ID=236786 /ORGANISM="Florenciella sp., Strain RCC1007" /LENGTH=67 /DNA_ID=CAMNT_0053292861 /DNA_START=223 /DNA_END=426 /DNA_ORIENTATION=-